MEIKELKLVIVTGIARMVIQGNIPSATHAFSFDIDVSAPFAMGIQPNSAVVSLALANISNGSGATDMEYDFKNTSNTFAAGIVRVSGEVAVGDTDGFLRGISFVCFARYP